MLLLFIGGLQVNISAEEYPNVLVIKFKDKAEEDLVLPLENTQLVFYACSDRNHLIMVNGTRVGYFDEIQSMTYEYSEEVAMGIDNVDFSEKSNFCVYCMDGKCVFSGDISASQKAVESLPPGVYVIRENGRTYKIVK